MQGKASKTLLVDEVDKFQTKSIIPSMQPFCDDIQEERSSELLRHPGDIVAAAITLQRFFRKIRQRSSVKGAFSTQDLEASSSATEEASSATESANEEESNSETSEASRK